MPCRGALHWERKEDQKSPHRRRISPAVMGAPCIVLTRQTCRLLEFCSLFLPIGRVLLRDFPDHPAGIPDGDHTGGDRFCDYGPPLITACPPIHTSSPMVTGLPYSSMSALTSASMGCEGV